MRVYQRHDSFKIDSFKRDQNGYLRATAFPTRAGVFIYRRGDGSISRELRHPDDVFDVDSLDSLKMRPLTNGHPSEQLDSKNTKELQIGHIGDNIIRDGNKVKIEILVTDEDAINMIESGEKDQLSCGYHIDYAENSGEFEGERFDVQQKNIVYNHVSLVKRGRAGSECKIKLDSLDGELITSDELKNDKENTIMKVIKNKLDKVKAGSFSLDSDSIEYSEDALPAVEKLMAREDLLKKELENKQVSLDEIEGERDQLKEKYESLKKDSESKIDKKDLNALVKDRVLLLSVASHLKVDVSQEDSDMDIKKNVILKQYPNTTLEGKAEGYVCGRFDDILGDLEHEKNRSSVNDAKEAASRQGNSVGNQVLSSRDAYIKRLQGGN